MLIEYIKHILMKITFFLDLNLFHKYAFSLSPKNTASLILHY